MRTVFASLLATILLVLLPVESGAQTNGVALVPKPIQKLASDFQGKRPEEIRALIIKRFGPPRRDIGSGLAILQWDIYDGVLTFHPLSGPTFFNPKTKSGSRLMRTTNKVRANLFGSYEMTTLPDPKNHGARYWLGNLAISSDTTYTFKKNSEDVRASNFFVIHPNGHVAVRYLEPIASETLLESVGEGATVAELVFTSPDGKTQAIYSIASSEQSRTLTFVGDKSIPFIMDKSWENHWK